MGKLELLDTVVITGDSAEAFNLNGTRGRIIAIEYLNRWPYLVRCDDFNGVAVWLDATQIEETNAAD